MSFHKILAFMKISMCGLLVIFIWSYWLAWILGYKD